MASIPALSAQQSPRKAQERLYEVRCAHSSVRSLDQHRASLACTTLDTSAAAHGRLRVR